MCGDPVTLVLPGQFVLWLPLGQKENTLGLLLIVIPS